MNFIGFRKKKVWFSHWQIFRIKLNNASLSLYLTSNLIDILGVQYYSKVSFSVTLYIFYWADMIWYFTTLFLSIWSILVIVFDIQSRHIASTWGISIPNFIAPTYWVQLFYYRCIFRIKVQLKYSTDRYGRVCRFYSNTQYVTKWWWGCTTS